jgi:uncharacterized protein YdaT
MPWDETYYPVSMKHLPAMVRTKAIEIANALLEEGVEEGKAIRIGIARAKLWTERHATPKHQTTKPTRSHARNAHS